MSKAFPKWYEFFLGPLEKWKFKGIREELIQRAHGSVLEIGSGTGINFPYYQNVTRVIAIEPIQEMIDGSAKRKALSVVPIQFLKKVLRSCHLLMIILIR